jgi:23S rRNA (cytosine1962-C5)-methyltransferase
MNYELIDSGEGRRLEKYGDYILDRPDPQIIWKKNLPESEWEKSDAIFERITEDKGAWKIKTKMPEKWELNHSGIKFWAKLSPFKHTGVFPEQASQWDYINKQISKSANKQINFLNLFAYTGIATLFAAKAGAKVTHVDSSKPAITWANENRNLNGMENLPIRWIVDDVLKFTEREAKRGVKYDAIIMDPPVYGHGPTGEVWDFNKDFPKLLNNCKEILSENPLFILVNAYAISSSSITLANTLNDYFGKLGGNIENGELMLTESSILAGGPTGRRLSTGIWARWSK